MLQPRKKIIISGGGTGGHIFPAIAIADGLKQRLGDPEILFIGAKGRMEMEKVPAAGYSIEGLWISGLQRRLTIKNLSFPFKLISSMLKARRIMKKFKPDVAIGTGGYASGPMLRVASKKGIPSLIQEQNSFPGMTNRLLGKTVDTVCVAFDGMEKYFPSTHLVLTGNPVRQEIINMSDRKEDAIASFGLNPALKTILVIGGSQGARSVNRAISGGLTAILGSDAQLIWQCGKAFLDSANEVCKTLPAEHYERVKVYDFIARMDLAYTAADMVISRAGAIAISELCIAGKPLILVPLPSAAEDHQTKNARSLEEKGAAIMVADSRIEEELIPALRILMENAEQRALMSTNIKALARFEATERIVDEVIILLEK